MAKFADADVEVTLTGAEWTAILGRLCEKPLSAKGFETYASGHKKLINRLLESAGVTSAEQL